MQTAQTITRRTVTSRTSDSGGSGGLEEVIGQSYVPKCIQKNVIIQRSGPGFRASRTSGIYGGGSYSSQMRMSSSINPTVFSQMAGAGVSDFRDHREKEKRDMQDCNERLATYIEKVRWLEAQNKQLLAENEALRKRKQEDWRPIRDMYESELNQAREVIKEMSTQKGVNEAKMASLQDQVESLKDLVSQYDANAKDYANKIDRLNSQIGEYEGELTTLRLRCGSLEDEVAKLRALIAKYKDENARLRADLDAETAAHIEQEVLAQTWEEQNQFLQELLEKLQLTQQEPVQVKGMDVESYFKSELRTAIQDLEQTYNDKLEHMQLECESKVQQQMNQLKSGNVRDTMEAEHAKSEVKRMRDLLSERNARISELEMKLAATCAERDSKAEELCQLQIEIDKLRADYERRLADITAQVEALMAQLQMMTDAKLSTELEIACYKKLLEGEENRTGLRQLVEQTIGVRGTGASQLTEIIGGGGMSSGSSSTVSTSMRIQKSRSGALGIKEVEPTGGFITIDLDPSAKEARNMQSVKLIKRSPNGVEKVLMDFSRWDHGQVRPGARVTLYSKSRKQSVSDPKTEIVCPDIYVFDMNPGEFCLMDKGQEVSTTRLSTTTY